MTIVLALMIDWKLTAHADAHAGRSCCWICCSTVQRDGGGWRAGYRVIDENSPLRVERPADGELLAKRRLDQRASAQLSSGSRPRGK